MAVMQLRGQQRATTFNWTSELTSDLFVLLVCLELPAQKSLVSCFDCIVYVCGWLQLNSRTNKVHVSEEDPWASCSDVCITTLLVQIS